MDDESNEIKIAFRGCHGTLQCASGKADEALVSHVVGKGSTPLRRHRSGQAGGHGGTEYVAALFALDRKTIRQGLEDLDAPEDPASHRIRKQGADGNG